MKAGTPGLFFKEAPLCDSLAVSHPPGLSLQAPVIHHFLTHTPFLILPGCASAEHGLPYSSHPPLPPPDFPRNAHAPFPIISMHHPDLHELKLSSPGWPPPRAKSISCCFCILSTEQQAARGLAEHRHSANMALN